MKCTAKRSVRKRLPCTRLSWLVTENTPSRPSLMSLSMIRDPGVFHSDTAGSALADPQPTQPDDAVAAHQHVVRAVEIDADQVALERAVLQHCAVGVTSEEDAGVLADQAHARAANGQAAQHGVGRGDGQGVAGAAAVDDRAGSALQGDAGRCDRDRAAVQPGARRSMSPGAARATAAPRPSPAGTSIMRRARHATGKAHKCRCQQQWACASHGQTDFGCTIIRPDISMCSAWQNHWQYHQCTPGRSAMKVTEAVSSGEISIMTP